MASCCRRVAARFMSRLRNLVPSLRVSSVSYFMLCTSMQLVRDLELEIVHA